MLTSLFNTVHPNLHTARRGTNYTGIPNKLVSHCISHIKWTNLVPVHYLLCLGVPDFHGLVK